MQRKVKFECDCWVRMPPAVALGANWGQTKKQQSQIKMKNKQKTNNLHNLRNWIHVAESKF